jgi:hypothetical protein
MRYRAFNIDFDTDGEEIGLPTELVIEMDDDADPNLELADAISDKTGWCVNSFEFEKLDADPAPAVRI